MISKFLIIVFYISIVAFMIYGYNKNNIENDLYSMYNFNNSHGELETVKSAALDELKIKYSNILNNLNIINIALIILSSLFSTLSLIIKKVFFKVKASSIFILLSFLSFSLHIFVNNHIDSVKSEVNFSQVKILLSNDINEIEKVVNGKNKI